MGGLGWWVFLHNRNRLTNPSIFVLIGAIERLFGVNNTKGILRTIDSSGMFMEEPDRIVPQGGMPGTRRLGHSIDSIGPSVLKAQISSVYGLP
jgi:hypothetical protein